MKNNHLQKSAKSQVKLFFDTFGESELDVDNSHNILLNLIMTHNFFSALYAMITIRRNNNRIYGPIELSSLQGNILRFLEVNNIKRIHELDEEPICTLFKLQVLK